MRCLLALALVLVVAAGVPAAPPGASDDVQDVVYLGDAQVLLIRLHVRIDGKPFRAVWEEAMNGVFAVLDRNGDGFLDKKEAQRIPMAATLLGNAPYYYNGMPSTVMDRNGDGKISRDELAHYYRQTGAAPLQLRMNPQAQAQQGYAVLVDSGGIIAAGGGDSSNALTQRLFQLLDADKDGKLSAGEMAAAPTVLGKLDANDDEMVSSNELQGQPLDNRVVYNTVVFNPSGMPQNFSSSSFLAVEPTKVDRALSRQLLARYGSKPGKPARKTLTRADLGLSKEAFARLDVDENGTLDAEELAHFTRRPADLEVMVRLGKTSREEAYLERWGSSAHDRKVERSIDGTLSLGAGVTRLQVQRGNEPEKNRILLQQIRLQYKTQLLAADQDKNGYLDLKEAQQNGFFASQFKAMDRDGDGKLFEKEMVEYLDEINKMQELAVGCCVTVQVQDQGQGLFRLVDSNHDSRLSVREMRQMGKLVAQLDSDGDGKLGPGELPRVYRLELSRAPGQVQQQFVRRVIRAQGAMPESPAQPSPQGPTWFRKMDRNGDGDVSRREFLGSEEHFRKIDSDGDGLISLEEAIKADAALRKEQGKGP